MQINEDIDLAQLRSAAKISQADMAAHLNVSQSQVSRYEQDPDEVPHKVIRKWVAFCGFVASSKGIDIGDPLVEINERTKLILDYAQTEPEEPEGLIRSNVPLSVESFIEGVKMVARKPRVGVLGRFDMGKSRLSNILLGGDRLPTSYQPATSVICLIRHISDKPVWQPEDVWMMSEGFSLDRANDQAHCQEHKLFAGGFDALKQYGTHTGSGREYKAFAAVIYVDAPLLIGCDMLDLPGYGHSEDDKDRAEMGHKTVDVMIYLSTAQGFLEQNDISYLSVLIRHLPTYETPEDRIDPLRNLLVVATRADIVGNQIDGILDAASKRAYKHLDNAISERVSLTRVEISHDDFRQRFFTFSADNPSIREAFEEDLKDLLINVLPGCMLTRMRDYVKTAKSAATGVCGKWINGLTLALTEREQAQAAITALQEKEPARLRKKKAHEQHILAMVKEFRSESFGVISTTFRELTTVDAIEAMIKNRYQKKKEAQQLAGSYLLESIQKKITDAVQEKARKLGEEMDRFLEQYKVSIEGSTFLSDSWSFNARGTFLGAIAGIGTFGALAAWASIAAAGSNLGAYILIPSVVSFLSSIGIGVGGTSAAISVVSAIGGPITIGIGVSIGVATLVFALFGDSWQKKLAKKIRDSVMNERTEEKLRGSINQYWNDTESAFARAVEETERAYKAKLDSLHNLAFTTSREVMEIELKFARELRDFFGGMPWRAIKS